MEVYVSDMLHTNLQVPVCISTWNVIYIGTQLYASDLQLHGIEFLVLFIETQFM